MELTIVVSYLGYPARYAICRESQGVYGARLLAYEGPDAITPPETFTMVRGTRTWIGSCDEAWFVAEVGRALETAVGEEPFPAGKSVLPATVCNPDQDLTHH